MRHARAHSLRTAPPSSWLFLPARAPPDRDSPFLKAAGGQPPEQAGHTRARGRRLQSPLPERKKLSEQPRAQRDRALLLSGSGTSRGLEGIAVGEHQPGAKPRVSPGTEGEEMARAVRQATRSAEASLEGTRSTQGEPISRARAARATLVQERADFEGGQRDGAEGTERAGRFLL